MSNISPLLLLSLGELLLVTSILSVVMIALAVFKKRRDRASAQKLINRIKQDETRRQGETRELMGRNFGLQGEILTALVKKISREEKFFYQTLINLYLKRDAGALEVIHVAFEGATEPYRTLQLPKVEPAPEQKAEESEESAEIARLREENARLSEELRITMDTMGRMLSEYSSMYSGGSDSELDKEKILGMFRAEAEAKPIEETEAEAAAADEQMSDVASAEPATEVTDAVAAPADMEAVVEPEQALGGEKAPQASALPDGEAADDFEDALLSLDDNQFDQPGDALEAVTKRVS